MAQAVGVRRLHLKDARIVGARGKIGALDQRHPLGEPHLIGRVQHGIKIVLVRFGKTGFHDGGRTFRDQGRHARGFANLLRAEVVAVGVASALACDHTHTDAHSDAFGGALDDLLINTNGAGGDVFEIQVGVFAARH